MDRVYNTYQGERLIGSFIRSYRRNMRLLDAIEVAMVLGTAAFACTFGSEYPRTTIGVICGGVLALLVSGKYTLSRIRSCREELEDRLSGLELNNGEQNGRSI